MRDLDRTCAFGLGCMMTTEEVGGATGREVGCKDDVTMIAFANWGVGCDKDAPLLRQFRRGRPELMVFYCLPTGTEILRILRNQMYVVGASS